MSFRALVLLAGGRNVPGLFPGGRVVLVACSGGELASVWCVFGGWRWRPWALLWQPVAARCTDSLVAVVVWRSCVSPW